MASDLLTIAVTTVGGLTGAVGALYGAALKSANNSYKEDANALRGLLDTKDAIITEQEKHIAVMEGGIQTLRETITSAPDIAKLSTEIARQHKEILHELGKVATAVSEMAKSLTAASQLMSTLKRKERRK